MSQSITNFLSTFIIDKGLLQLSIDHPDNAVYVAGAPVFTGGVPNDKNIYFGPAQRKREGSEKKDILGTCYQWVDVDDLVMPEPTFPVSAIVGSGHGWHLYWKMREPIHDTPLIEANNKILIGDIPTADGSCWNVNRLMRLPGSINQGTPEKNETPTPSTLHHINPSIVYDSQDFAVLASLNDDIRYLIRSGESGTYASRSERDWAVIRAMIIAGASDRLIWMIFQHQLVGAKYREHTTPDHYLTFTVGKVREDLKVIPPTAGEQGESISKKDRRGRAAGAQPLHLLERPDGYYVVATTQRRISTFTLDPLMLLSGSHFAADDAIVCNVQANGVVWENITFPKQAFSSITQMDKSCPNALWQWLGHDSDVRQLLPFLMERLKEKGNGVIRSISATPVIGLHMLEGQPPMFLGNKQTLTCMECHNGIDGSLTWLPTNRLHPEMDLLPAVTDEDLANLRRLLPKINTPDVVWSMLGWYGASVLKPWIEKQGLRFPILNITGTKGAGKTTLSQRVMMALFGQQEAKGFDAGTTKFVRIALLGSTNAVPIAFSEFRFESVEQFIRTILMAYDEGRDARGRGDQTTVEYILSAPISVDGEDVISDAAARERIIVARLRPDTIAEGTEGYLAFQELRTVLPRHFAGYYIQHCLQWIQDDTLLSVLQEAKDAIHAAFPSRLPDRVRNNYTVALFGAFLVARVLDMPPPSASVFEASLREVVQLDTGRSHTLIDDFIEALCISMKQNAHSSFQWVYVPEKNGVYFNLTGAHAWWLALRKRQGRSGMERDSIGSQLIEAPYYIERTKMRGSLMYGVDLALAQEHGLDVPDRLSSATIIINV